MEFLTIIGVAIGYYVFIKLLDTDSSKTSSGSSSLGASSSTLKPATSGKDQEERKQEIIHTIFQKSLDAVLEEDKQEWQKQYRKYLRSKRWQRVRERVLAAANHTCTICGGTATQVHHHKYPAGHKRGEFKRENYAYLEAVCSKCHRTIHGI